MTGAGAVSSEQEQETVDPGLTDVACGHCRVVDATQPGQLGNATRNGRNESGSVADLLPGAIRHREAAATVARR